MAQHTNDPHSAISEILTKLAVNTLKLYWKLLYINYTGKREQVVYRLAAYLSSVGGKQHAMNRLDKSVTWVLYPKTGHVAPTIKPILLQPISEQSIGLQCIWFDGRGNTITWTQWDKSQHTLWVQVFACMVRYVCPLCQMKAMDPAWEILKTLMPPVIVAREWPVLSLSRASTRQFDYSESIERSIFAGDGLLQVQIRCLNLDEIPYSQNWPQTGYIELNQRNIKEFRQSANPNAKKRKDDFLNVTAILKTGKNLINMVKSDDADAYVYGVFQIRHKGADEVVSEFLQGDALSYKDGLSLMLERFQGPEEVVSESIKLSVKWPYSMTLILTPVRGDNCKHPQCFDLRQFWHLQSISKVNRWKCPICKDFAISLVRDGYFSEIQKTAQAVEDPVYVEIFPNGAYRIITFADIKNETKAQQIIQPIETPTTNQQTYNTAQVPMTIIDDQNLQETMPIDSQEPGQEVLIAEMDDSMQADEDVLMADDQAELSPLEAEPDLLNADQTDINILKRSIAKKSKKNKAVEEEEYQYQESSRPDILSIEEPETDLLNVDYDDIHSLQKTMKKKFAKKKAAPFKVIKKQKAPEKTPETPQLDPLDALLATIAEESRVREHIQFETQIPDPPRPAKKSAQNVVLPTIPLYTMKEGKIPIPGEEQPAKQPSFFLKNALLPPMKPTGPKKLLPVVPQLPPEQVYQPQLRDPQDNDEELVQLVWDVEREVRQIRSTHQQHRLELGNPTIVPRQRSPERPIIPPPLPPAPIIPTAMRPRVRRQRGKEITCPIEID